LPNAPPFATFAIAAVVSAFTVKGAGALNEGRLQRRRLVAQFAQKHSVSKRTRARPIQPAEICAIYISFEPALGRSARGSRKIRARSRVQGNIRFGSLADFIRWPVEDTGALIASYGCFSKAAAPSKAGKGCTTTYVGIFAR
jgi:hypothetical protein